MGCTHSEAIKTLRTADDEIAMLICDGFCDTMVSRGASCAADVDESLVLSRHSSVITADTRTLVSVVTADTHTLVTAADVTGSYWCQFNSWL